MVKTPDGDELGYETEQISGTGLTKLRLDMSTLYGKSETALSVIVRKLP